MDRQDPFAGSWTIDVEQSRYDLGLPPRFARYVIARDGEGYVMTASWMNADEDQVVITFGGIPDGERRPAPQPGPVDEISFCRPTPRRLDSTAYCRGEIVAHATRELSADAEVLTIVQSGKNPQGRPFRNLAVYRRMR